jgi:adenylyl cyclase-associated protein
MSSFPIELHLDNCKKTAVVVDECISGLDIGNSQSIQAQVMGKLPLVSIDKTDGCQVYLSKDSLSADIVTAKSSEMNIMIPKANGEFNEVPLPEQFKSKWNGKTMVTEPTEIAG